MIVYATVKDSWLNFEKCAKYNSRRTILWIRALFKVGSFTIFFFYLYRLNFVNLSITLKDSSVQIAQFLIDFKNYQGIICFCHLSIIIIIIYTNDKYIKNWKFTIFFTIKWIVFSYIWKRKKKIAHVLKSGRISGISAQHWRIIFMASGGAAPLETDGRIKGGGRFIFVIISE